MNKLMKNNTSFILKSIWKEYWFVSLDTNSKFLFLYLNTCQHINIANWGKLPKSLIVYETGMKANEVDEALNVLESAGIIKYFDGMIAIRNRVSSLSNNPGVFKSRSKYLEEAPEWVQEFLQEDLDDLENDIIFSENFQTIRDITGKYPPKLFWRRIKNLFDTVGVDVKLLEQCYQEWLMNGKDPNKFDWLFITYRSRMGRKAIGM